MGFWGDLRDNLQIWSEEQETKKTDSWGRPRPGMSFKLVMLGVLGLVLFLGANLWNQGGGEVAPAPETGLIEETSRVESPEVEGERTDLQRYEETLSARLTQVLAQVEGAGEVEVYVNLASGPEFDFARNENLETRITEERDTGGGQRVIQETREDVQLVMASGPGGGNQGLVQVERHPNVQGVLVVASGAGDSRVKAQLTRAAQVVLGLGSHQVVVLPRER